MSGPLHLLARYDAATPAALFLVCGLIMSASERVVLDAKRATCPECVHVAKRMRPPKAGA